MSSNESVSTEQTEKLKEFDAVLRRLRKDCPWDRKQTWESLRTNTIEEVFELAQAIEDNDLADVRKELGDVFLHVAFYSLIAEEKGQFSFADVLDSLTRKLIFRHPHVYGTQKADTADEVLSEWEKIKLREKDGNHTVLGGVARALPALIKAYRIQQKVKGVGFDWKEPSQVWDKVSEEMSEFTDEVQSKDADRMEAEMGDLIFAVVNLARVYNINPENALERTNRKFTNRFNYIEQKAKEAGRQLQDMTLEEMDALWDEAKQIYR